MLNLPTTMTHEVAPACLSELRAGLQHEAATVVVDGELAVRSTMKLTCAFDHRVADGAQVAGFLTEVRALIEAPETALLDL